MQDVVNIYIVLSFYIYIILASIIYLVMQDVINSFFISKSKKIDFVFKEEVIRQLNLIKEDKKISKIDIQYVVKKLKKKKYIYEFIDIISEFNKVEENYKFTPKYINNFRVIVESFLKKFKRKDETMKAYCAVVLGEFRLSNYEINTFLINSLNTKSIYLRVASFEAISKIGNLKSFIEAIKYISDSKCYINNKIFIDILNQFHGDKYLLNKKLMEDFDSFNDNLKRDIIEHFKNNKVDFVKKDLIKILDDDNYDKEVRISIIKYFSKIKYNNAQKLIIKVLKSEDWEYRAICASALAIYNNEDSIKALLESVTDKNWYVRYNSAISLLKFSDDVVNIVFSKGDKYSRDIIFYAMFMENKISYDEYVEKSRLLGVGNNV